MKPRPTVNDPQGDLFEVRLSGLVNLNHAFKFSGERVVEQWLESPWQYFCGETFFRHEFHCNPSSLTRWRQCLGEEG